MLYGYIVQIGVAGNALKLFRTRLHRLNGGREGDRSYPLLEVGNERHVRTRLAGLASARLACERASELTRCRRTTLIFAPPSNHCPGLLPAHYHPHLGPAGRGAGWSLRGPLFEPQDLVVCCRLVRLWHPIRRCAEHSTDRGPG